MWGTEATKVGSDLVCSNNGVSLFPSPGSMAKGEEDGEDGEVVLFGCSIALIQYSIMRWSVLDGWPPSDFLSLSGYNS